MRLTNELDVGVPLGEAWHTLLDVPRLARALPGAAVEPDADGGVWRGTMDVRRGPVTTRYTATARVQDADEDEHVASLRVEGREARGRGSAAATITVRLEGRDGGTHVAVETDLQVAGRHAQPDRSLLEDAAGSVLGELAERLGSRLREVPRAGGAEADEVPRRVGAEADEVPRRAGAEAQGGFRVGGARRRPLLERAALVLAGAAVGSVAGYVAGRRA